MAVRFEKHSSTITYLSDDAWYLIFEKLDSNVDRASFGLTCRRFLDIQNSSCKFLDRGHSVSSICSYEIDPVILETLLCRFRQLESLSLCCQSEISDSVLTKLEKFGSKLHSLCLAFCHRVTKKGLASVASGCPFLSVISLRNSSITDSGLEILTKSCKLLVEVNLAWCQGITDSGISSLNKNCRQLKALEISGCSKILGIGFLGCSASLAYLEAKYCGFDPMGVTGITCGGGLEYLNLYNLKISPISEDGLVAIGSATNLKILDFQMCSYVTDDCIISISKRCPLLQEWNLSSCNNFGISGWESIGLHCQNLETLHVNRCSNLCDRGLLSLANGCERLSLIYMKDCSRISPSGMSSFKIMREDVEIKEIFGIRIFQAGHFNRPFLKYVFRYKPG